MKKHAFFFFAWFLCAKISAQSGLNAAFTTPYKQYYFSSFCASNNNLVGWGIGFDTFDRQGMAITKLDTFGNILNQTFYLDSLFDPLSVHFHWGKIIPTSDGGYAATAATFFRNSALFFKFDQDCNIEFVREFPDTVNLSNFFYIPLQLDDGYLLFGNIQLPDYRNTGFLRRIDQTGNTIWFKQVTTNNSKNYVNDAALLNDSTIIVALNTYAIIDVFDFRAIRAGVLLYDLNGNLLDEWVSGFEPEVGLMRKIFSIGNDEAILFGQYLDTVLVVAQSVEVPLYQPTLSSINRDLEIQWSKHFGPVAQLSIINIFRDIKFSSDDNMVGVGTVSNTNPNGGALGWLYKFNSEGDTLWDRRFPTPFPDSFPNGGELYGAGLLSSGNIVAGGKAQDANSNVYCWVVKISNDGCFDTLFCQTSAMHERPVYMPGSLELFPNPATEVLNIRLPESLDAVRLSVANPSGQEVLFKTVTAHAGIASITVSSLPAGVYFLQVQTKSGLVYGQRFVVQR